MSEKHWNDEMMALEAKASMAEETNSLSMESWDWRFRAEAAEAEIKKMRETLEHAKIALYQVRNNFESMQRKQRTLLALCLKHLDPALFYYNLSTNPLERRQQMEHRTEAKRRLVEALESYLQATKPKPKQEGGE